MTEVAAGLGPSNCKSIIGSSTHKRVCALFGWEKIQEARNLPAFVGSHRAVRRDYNGVVREVEVAEAAAKSVGGCDMADGLGSDRTEGECADLGRHSIFWRACCRKIVIVCLHKNLLPTNFSQE